MMRALCVPKLDFDHSDAELVVDVSVIRSCVFPSKGSRSQRKSSRRALYLHLNPNHDVIGRPLASRVKGRADAGPQSSNEMEQR